MLYTDILKEFEKLSPYFSNERLTRALLEKPFILYRLGYGGKRYYLRELENDVQIFQSLTTFLALTMPKGTTKYLEDWKDSFGSKEDSALISAYAALCGTFGHICYSMVIKGAKEFPIILERAFEKVIESFLKHGEETNPSKKAHRFFVENKESIFLQMQHYLIAFHKWIEDYEVNFIANEFPIFDTDYEIEIVFSGKKTVKKPLAFSNPNDSELKQKRDKGIDGIGTCIDCVCSMLESKRTNTNPNPNRVTAIVDFKFSFDYSHFEKVLAGESLVYFKTYLEDFKEDSEKKSKSYSFGDAYALQLWFCMQAWNKWLESNEAWQIQGIEKVTHIYNFRPFAHKGELRSNTSFYVCHEHTNHDILAKKFAHCFLGMELYSLGLFSDFKVEKIEGNSIAHIPFIDIMKERIKQTQNESKSLQNE